MSEGDVTDFDKDDTEFKLAMKRSHTASDAKTPSMDDTRVIDDQPETPSNYVTLDTFAELTAHLKARKCRLCSEPFFCSELDIRHMFQNWANGAVNQLSCNIRCRNCNTRSCIACEPEPFTKPSTIGFASVDRKQKVSWCCVGGRLFLIWALLCGFDRHIWESRNVAKAPKQVKSNSKRQKKAKKPSRGGGYGFMGSNRPPTGTMPSGLGYGGDGHSGHPFEDDTDEDTDEGDDTDGFNGIGHGANAAAALEYAYGIAPDPPEGPGHGLHSKRPAVPKKDDKVSKVQEAHKAQDIYSRMILGFLTDLLPSLGRESCFDFDPPGAVLEMLKNSKILHYCAELLRNDSLVDVTERKDLYQTLFSFLVMVGSHSSTSAAVFGPQFIRPETIDLLTLSFITGVPDLKDRVSTFAECLRNLATQSSMVLRSAKANKEDFADSHGQVMISVCNQISDLAEFIQKNTVTESNSDNGKAATVVPDDLSVRDVEGETMKQTHHYWDRANALTSSQPGRVKRLITEITTLQTGLPPGIFVRYCENRPDIIKCVIVGPIGTPYENGLFEFDIFCGAEFPNKPPQVNFKGTAGGKININPNLYADGKVCLSLLGTWSGEPWNPAASTLLQVLISIQAMILCEEPWYNEPGREAGYTRSPNSRSAMYNNDIRKHTVRTAILAWLDKPPPLWEDVVDYHFKQQGNTILKTVEEWTKATAFEPKMTAPDRSMPGEVWDYDEELESIIAASRIPPGQNDMGSMLPRLQTALNKYGATFIVEYVAPRASGKRVVSPRSQMLHSSQWGPPSWASVAGSSAATPGTMGAPFDPNASLDDPTEHLSFHGQQAAAMRGGHHGGRGGHYSAADFDWAHGVAESQASDPAGSSEAPRYDLRSSTRGRGSGDDSSTRGGRGGSTSTLPTPSDSTTNSVRGRGGLFQTIHAGFGRGRGRGDGNGGDGLAPVFPPLSPGPYMSFHGRGRGGASLSDNFTMGDASPWHRGGLGRGRGGGLRGDGRGGRGRGRGRGDRGGGGSL